MPAEQIGIEDRSEHGRIVLWANCFPGLRLFNQFASEIRSGEIVSNVKIIVHKQTTQFHTNELLRERLIREVCDNLVAVLDSIRTVRAGKTN